MRVNVYAEEMSDRIEIIVKEIDGKEYTGLRIYLELPATVDGKQYKGPFMHRPGDDDSSAVTFWGKRSLLATMKTVVARLEEHYQGRDRHLPLPLIDVVRSNIVACHACGIHRPPGAGGVAWHYIGDKALCVACGDELQNPPSDPVPAIPVPVGVVLADGRTVQVGIDEILSINGIPRESFNCPKCKSIGTVVANGACLSLVCQVKADVDRQLARYGEELDRSNVGIVLADGRTVDPDLAPMYSKAHESESASYSETSATITTTSEKCPVCREEVSRGIHTGQECPNCGVGPNG